MSIPMLRNSADIWPDDAPPGTFDIHLARVQDVPAATAHIVFVCPNQRRCGVFLGPQHADGEPGKKVWGWNGDVDRPTCTPSLSCVQKVVDGKVQGGCGWHGFITAGELR